MLKATSIGDIGMSKYIIKNCPALQQTYYCNTHHSKCQDCTDCVLKQIVEKSKDAQNEYPKHFSDGELDMFVSGRFNMAGNILALLDIQEVSE